MKKEHILGILFFAGLWGISEAVLGDALYSGNIPYASVPLTIIGFVLMAGARVYFPQIGTATLVAGCAMLYKFLNAPFFACHLLGILLTGMCYDLFVCGCGRLFELRIVRPDDYVRLPVRVLGAGGSFRRDTTYSNQRQHGGPGLRNPGAGEFASRSADQSKLRQAF